MISYEISKNGTTKKRRAEVWFAEDSLLIFVLWKFYLVEDLLLISC